MSRITRKQIQDLFVHWCKATGRRVSKGYKDVGAWTLQEVLHGWHVCQQGENGTLDDRITLRTFSNRELWDVLQFSMNERRESAGENVSSIAVAQAVLEWARTPGDHGGNPYCKEFVKLAQRALPDGIPADLQDAAAEVAERYSGEEMDQFERDAGAVPGFREGD